MLLSASLNFMSVAQAGEIATSVQFLSGNQRFEDPVSYTTSKDCGGVPAEAGPRYSKSSKFHWGTGTGALEREMCSSGVPMRSSGGVLLRRAMMFFSW